MKSLGLTLATLFSFLLPAAPGFSQSPAALPLTRRANVQETLHGVTITDPYRWLEEQNSPETRAWIASENAYTDALLNGRAGRDKLERRFAELRKVDSIQLPIERNGRYVYRKRLAGQEQYVIYARRGAEGKEELLIDPNPMAPDHSTSAEIVQLSHDGRILAYTIRKAGSDEAELHFFDIAEHRNLPDILPTATYSSVSFLADRSGFYYSLRANSLPRLRFHKLGTSPKDDLEVFGQGYGADKVVTSHVSDDGRHLVIHVIYGSAASRVEIWTQDLTRKGPVRPIVNDIDARFSALPAGNQLLLYTNWKAPRGRVLVVDYSQPDSSKWREIIPEKSDVIDGVRVAGGKIFVTYLHDVASQVTLFDMDGQPAGQLKFPALGSISGIIGHWQGKDAFVQFSSYTIPPTIYRYEIASDKQSEWARVKAPVQNHSFEVKQVWFNSKDGTRVPMFLAHKRGLQLDGSHPGLLTGYGGFNLSETPSFSPWAVVWAEHGGVFASANLRGGDEFGEQWHRAGMLENKQNVFDDFVGAAQWLIQSRYTDAGHLAIVGASNGGLLVGAAMTQRPELFRAVLCRYPLLDMIRYDKFMKAQLWVSEYGSAENPEQFKYIYAYSPYQHVSEGKKYPTVLFVTGDGDTRVAPLHARKMAALMQSVATPDRPVLLRYETTTGHVAGSRSVTQTLADDVEEFTFLFWQLGITP